MGYPVQEPPRRRWVERLGTLVIVGFLGALAAVPWRRAFETPPEPVATPSASAAARPPQSSREPVARGLTPQEVERDRERRRSDPAFEDEAIEWRRAGPEPRLMLLAYRETFIAVLQYRYGARVRALDLDDSRHGAVLEVVPPGGGKPVWWTLRISQDAGGAWQVALGTDRMRVSAPFISAGLARYPLEQDHGRAVRDVPQFLAAAGLAWTARSIPAGPALPAWQPGGLAELAEALRGLRGDPLQVTKAALNRAAYALAWTALMDYRVAPAVALDRAAQALALTAVTRDSGTPIEYENFDAEWLATRAPLCDLWPRSNERQPRAPELQVLAAALAGFGFDRARPAGPLLPAALAACVRATHLEVGSRLSAILGWVQSASEARAVVPFLSTFLDFGVTAQTYQAVAPILLDDLRAALGNALPLTAEEQAQVGRAAALSCAGVVPAARKLIRAGLDAPELADRILLREGGERLLRAVRVVAQAYLQYGWNDRQDQLLAALDREADWHHPQLQWLRNDRTVRDARPAPPGDRSQYTVSSSYALMPGVVGGSFETFSTVDWLDGMALGALENFPGHASMTHRAARIFARGRLGLAAGLYEHLARTFGRERPAFYAKGEMPTLCQEFLFIGQAPPAAAGLTQVVALLYSKLAMQGRASDSMEVLERALAADPSSQTLCTMLIDGYSLSGRFDLAEAALATHLASNPPGLGSYRCRLDLAGWMLVDPRRYRTKILELSRQGARCAAAWAYDAHAAICARVGLADEARAALTAEEAHYGTDPADHEARALVELLLSGGKLGWESYELRVRRNGFHGELRLEARTIEGAGIAFPTSEFGKHLRFIAALDRLERRFRVAPLDAADVERMLDAAVVDGNDPAGRAREGGWAVLALAAQTLARTVRSRPEVPRTLVRYVQLTGPLSPWSVRVLLDYAVTAGAGGNDLGALAALLRRHAVPELVTLLDALQGDLLRTWIGVTCAAPPDQLGLNDLLEYLWLTGRDGQFRAVADTFVLSKCPQPIGGALVKAAGSLARARAYLAKNGVPGDQLGRWGLDRMGDLYDPTPFRRFRPDPTPKNLLE